MTSFAMQVKGPIAICTRCHSEIHRWEPVDPAATVLSVVGMRVVYFIARAGCHACGNHRMSVTL